MLARHPSIDTIHLSNNSWNGLIRDSSFTINLVSSIKTAWLSPPSILAFTMPQLLGLNQRENSIKSTWFWNKNWTINSYNFSFWPKVLIPSPSKKGPYRRKRRRFVPKSNYKIRFFQNFKTPFSPTPISSKAEPHGSYQLG